MPWRPMLLLSISGELLPAFVPAVISMEIAQGEHGVDMMFSPAHTGSFEALVDDVFMTALYPAGADRIALIPKVGIVDHILPLG